MSNSSEKPAQTGGESDEVLTQRIQKAHKRELAEFKKEGGYSAEEISDDLEQKFKDAQGGVGGSGSESAREGGRNWEYIPDLGTTNVLMDEYINLLKQVRAVGKLYSHQPEQHLDYEMGDEFRELDVVSSSGYGIKISARPGLVQILNRESKEKASQAQPSEEPWTVILTPESVSLSFPKANFALSSDDPRNPSNWNSERIERYIREKVSPLVEEKKNEIDSTTRPQEEGQ